MASTPRRARSSEGDRVPAIVDAKAVRGVKTLGIFEPTSFAIPTDYIAVSETGLDTPSNTGDPRFTCSIYEPTPGPVLGGVLTDNQNSYLLLSFYYGYWNGATANAGTLNQVIEGVDTFTSSKAFGGSVPAENPRLEGTKMDPDDECGLIGSVFYNSRPSSAANGVAEWAQFMGQESTNTNQQQGGCMIVLPAENSIDGTTWSGTGSLGKRDLDWFVIGFSGGRVDYDDTGDTDATSAMNAGLSIDSSRANDDWLVMWRHRFEKNGGFPTGTERTLRGYFQLDGQDLFNIRTNNTTAGANKTGRGFQVHYGLQNFNGTMATPFVVQNLSVGEHTGTAVANMHETISSNGSQLDNLALLVLRTAAFKQFESIENTSAVTVTSDTWTDSNFTVTVEADGVSTFWIGFSTTVHQFEGQVRFRIVRNTSTILTTEGTDYPTWGKFATGSFTDGSDGVGDTDNDTLPFTMFWTDTPPAGTVSYKIQYRRNNGFTGANSAMFNTRDDGSDGFRGTLFAAELSLAVEQPTS